MADNSIEIGPNTKVKIWGVALISVLGGICIAAASVAVGVDRLNRNIEERPTRGELYWWTINAQRTVPGLPSFPPTKEKN